MFGSATPYVVAISSLLFCAASALTLFRVVDHFDPPDAKPASEPPRDIAVTSYATDKIAV